MASSDTTPADTTADDTTADDATADDTTADQGAVGAGGVAKTPYTGHARSDAYVLAVHWENGKITDEQFADGITEQLLELESSTRTSLPFSQVTMVIQQIARAPGTTKNRMGPAPLHVINRLIAHLSKISNLQSTLTVYKCLRDQKHSPSGFTLTSLMVACSRAKNIDAAFKLFAALEKEGVVPNTTNYNALISACSKAIDRERGLVAFEQMKARGVPFDTHTINIAIEMATNCGDIDLAIRLYSEIVTKQPEIEHQTGSSLLAHIIRECGKSKRLADALRFFEAARARPTFTPDVIVLSSLINACGLAGDVDKAMQIFQDMKNVYKVTPNIVTYGTICRWLALNNKLPEAMAIHNEMIAKNIQPNLATYNGLVEGTAMEARPDLARSIMEEMNKKRIRPNASTLTYVVSALLNVKLSAPLSAEDKEERLNQRAMLLPEAIDQQRFVEAVETARAFSDRHKVAMDAKALRILLEAAVQLGDWRRARLLLGLVSKQKRMLDNVKDLIARINQQPHEA